MPAPSIATETHSNADETVDITLAVDRAIALEVGDDGGGGPSIAGPDFAGIRTGDRDGDLEEHRASEE